MNIFMVVLLSICKFWRNLRLNGSDILNYRGSVCCAKVFAQIFFGYKIYSIGVNSKILSIFVSRMEMQL